MALQVRKPVTRARLAASFLAWGRPALEEVFAMHTPPKALELRFLVPPHLEDAARKAIEPYAVGECVSSPARPSSPTSPARCLLSGQELAELLGDSA